jgi:hypothetical protein
MIRCAVLITRVVDPIILSDTVISKLYREFLGEISTRFSMHRVQFQETFFQQDRARPYTANIILDALNEYFGYGVISNRSPGLSNYGWSWATYSYYLKPCCRFLCGCLKDNLYRNNHHTVDALKEEIPPAVVIITADTLSRIAANFQHRIRLVSDAGSSHIEHVVWQIILPSPPC